MAKWIEFEQLPNIPGRKTLRFDVWAKDPRFCLGRICWRNSWRKYAFEPKMETVYETTCLKDIAKFLDKIMADRKTDGD